MTLRSTNQEEYTDRYVTLSLCISSTCTLNLSRDFLQVLALPQTISTHVHSLSPSQMPPTSFKSLYLPVSFEDRHPLHRPSLLHSDTHSQQFVSFKDLHLLEIAAAGATSGIFTTPILAPLERVKCVLQVSKEVFYVVMLPHLCTAR